MAGRPVIGICSAVETARWGAWEALCDLVPRSYTLAVQRAGGLALLLPPDDVAAEEPDELLDLLDGLMFAGGADVDPGSYGARPHSETGSTRPERVRAGGRLATFIAVIITQMRPALSLSRPSSIVKRYR